MKRCIALPFVFALLISGTSLHAQTAAPEAAKVQTDVAAIDRVWSGHSVKSAILLTKTHIVIGYYDANRQLTIAARPINGGAWVYQKLDTWNDWDSHNYITLASDSAGRIHVAANMHSSPLTAFQSAPGGDILTLKRVAVLVDSKVERSMTYPIYLHDQGGRLILKYRDGSSGNGNEIYDVFDARAAKWTHLTTAPLVDGEGLRNAYFMGPVMGPDHRFHIAWVWRETPMAESNHDLSYAESPDLVHWFDSGHRPLALPIRMSQAEIVDPVPEKGGMINNNTLVGFDDKGRAMITYHKYDAAGNTQIYVARREAKGWHIAQVSQWSNYRWDFSGGGSLNSEIFVSGAAPIGNGLLKVPVVRLGQSIDFIIKADDLSLVEARTVRSLTDQLKETIKVPDGMQLNVVDVTDEKGTTYALAWPARPPHRDQPSADIPEPTTLLFVTLKAQ